MRNEKGQFTDAPTAPIKVRFERQYVMVPEAGCWIWTGPDKNQFGHGAFKLGGRKSPVRYAHRVAWELYVGPIPVGQQVLHRCDCPSCVNPHHLFLGTATENIEDMVAKGRQCKGSDVPHAKIDESIARLIKESAHLPTRTLAERHGISRQSVADIRFGRTWKHV